MGELVDGDRAAAPAGLGAARLRVTRPRRPAGPGWQTTRGTVDCSRGDPRGAGATWRRACSRRSTREAADSARDGAVRVDRQRRARLAAGRDRASAGRHRLRRRAPSNPTAHHGVHLGVVEVERTRAGGHVAAARVRRRRARSRRGRLADERSGRDRGARALGGSSAITGRPDAGARLPLARRRRAARRRPPRASARSSGRLAGYRGLFVAGSGFRSVGIPDCVADGRRDSARRVDSASRRTPCTAVALRDNVDAWRDPRCLVSVAAGRAAALGRERAAAPTSAKLLQTSRRRTRDSSRFPKRTAGSCGC